MLKKIKAALKERKYITVKYGDEMAVHYPKKRFSPYNGGRIKFYLNEEFHRDNTDIKVGFIPYLDEELPEILLIDEKTKQLSEIMYVVDGLGYLGRRDQRKPSLIKLENGKIIEEIHAYFQSSKNNKKHCSPKNGQSVISINQYTVPYKIKYNENGEIKQSESYWDFTNNRYNRSDDFNENLITFEEYRKILEVLNLNPINYKEWSKTQRMIISIYMDVEAYADIFKTLDIDVNKQSFLDNIEVFEMYYLS